MSNAPLSAGDPAPDFSLPDLNGKPVSRSLVAGRPYLMAFLRYASCPFCNLRMHELATRRNELGSSFEIVVVFNSDLDELQRHASRHEASFPVLADPDRTAYETWGVGRSLTGMLRGAVLKMPSLISGVLRYGAPTEITAASLNMPADFLVDPDGQIHTAHYGRDEGDHLPFDVIRGFADGFPG